jgi:integrase
MILVAIRTGMRVGELRGLKWGDLNLTNGTINIQRTATGKAKFKEQGTPKGGRSRLVPMSPDAARALATCRPVGRVEPDALVWPGRRGTRSEAGCDNGLKHALRRAGLTEKRLGWHTLRHTFASWLAIRGVSLRVIQELLGHSSITVTEIYAHLLPGATHHEHVAALDLAFVSAGAFSQPATKTLWGPPESSDDSDA